MRLRSIISWNLNGIRAVERKGELAWIFSGAYDIIALQETKLQDPNNSGTSFSHPTGYHAHWSGGERPGYSGVAVYTKEEPDSMRTHFGDSLLSKEGRVIEMTYGDVVFLNVYFPNGGSGDERLQYKLAFYDQFIDYITTLTKNGKKVIFCGDVNTAHKEIDLARPKENEKLSGFLPIERAWIDRVVDAGFVDAFRMFHEEGDAYTYWDMKSRARDRNVGWRIDYFFVHETIVSRVIDCFHLPDVMGSDHCPVVLKIQM
ncbi:MAG: exodeoxyribonuclease III [Patescibacteria group bacterium]